MFLLKMQPFLTLVFLSVIPCQAPGGLSHNPYQVQDSFGQSIEESLSVLFFSYDSVCPEGDNTYYFSDFQNISPELQSCEMSSGSNSFRYKLFYSSRYVHKETGYSYVLLSSRSNPSEELNLYILSPRDPMRQNRECSFSMFPAGIDSSRTPVYLGLMELFAQSFASSTSYCQNEVLAGYSQVSEVVPWLENEPAKDYASFKSAVIEVLHSLYGDKNPEVGRLETMASDRNNSKSVNKDTQTITDWCLVAREGDRKAKALEAARRQLQQPQKERSQPETTTLSALAADRESCCTGSAKEWQIVGNPNNWKEPVALDAISGEDTKKVSEKLQAKAKAPAKKPEQSKPKGNPRGKNTTGKKKSKQPKEDDDEYLNGLIFKQKKAEVLDETRLALAVQALSNQAQLFNGFQDKYRLCAIWKLFSDPTSRVGEDYLATVKVAVALFDLGIALCQDLEIGGETDLGVGAHKAFERYLNFNNQDVQNGVEAFFARALRCGKQIMSMADLFFTFNKGKHVEPYFFSDTFKADFIVTLDVLDGSFGVTSDLNSLPHSAGVCFAFLSIVRGIGVDYKRVFEKGVCIGVDVAVLDDDNIPTNASWLSRRSEIFRIFALRGPLDSKSLLEITNIHFRRTADVCSGALSNCCKRIVCHPEKPPVSLTQEKIESAINGLDWACWKQDVMRDKLVLFAKMLEMAVEPQSAMNEGFRILVISAAFEHAIVFYGMHRRAFGRGGDVKGAIAQILGGFNCEGSVTRLLTVLLWMGRVMEISREYNGDWGSVLAHSAKVNFFRMMYEYLLDEPRVEVISELARSFGGTLAFVAMGEAFCVWGLRSCGSFYRNTKQRPLNRAFFLRIASEYINEYSSSGSLEQDLQIGLQQDLSPEDKEYLKRKIEAFFVFNRNELRTNSF